MNLVELGQRISHLRKQQNLTLDEVASRTGLTRSWLSKVENFRITPSLQSLSLIAQALGTTVADLVAGLDQKPTLVVVRVSDRKVVERDRPESNIVYESLAHKRHNRTMDPFLLTVPPGETSRAAMPHEGEEFLMLLSGKVTFEHGQEALELVEGDCLYFDAAIPHRLLNRHKQPARVLCVFLQPHRN